MSTWVGHFQVYRWVSLKYMGGSNRSISRAQIEVHYALNYSSKPIDRFTHIRVTASDINILYGFNIT